MAICGRLRWTRQLRWLRWWRICGSPAALTVSGALRWEPPDALKTLPADLWTGGVPDCREAGWLLKRVVID